MDKDYLILPLYPFFQKRKNKQISWLICFTLELEIYIRLETYPFFEYSIYKESFCFYGLVGYYYKVKILEFLEEGVLC